MQETQETPSRVVEATVHGHAGDVLHTIRGQGHSIDEFTITPAEDDGSKLTLILPPSAQTEKKSVSHRSPEDTLVRARGVDTVRSIEASARQHLRMVLNIQHDQAAFLKYIVTHLGGSMKTEEGEVKLRLTAGVATIERLLTFLHAMPGLGSHVRVNPVFESLASRPEVEDLIGTSARTTHEQHGAEEVIIRITGDRRGDPQLDVIRQLEAEERKLDIRQISCHARPPMSQLFEMIVTLRLRDPSKIAALQGAIISGHVGVYGADLVRPDKARQTVQVVTDVQGARDLAHASGGALQAHYKRWADPRLVVSGALKPQSVARIVPDVADAHVPYATDVPVAIVPRAVRPPQKIRHGAGAFSGMPETADPQETNRDIRDGMRRYLLLELLPDIR
ncbi:MAG: hypothetical protein PHX87_03180 [Candidatus Peribacteraceae bacterium]|nr:hypothetical protein [Candidatus Peribacteraceae bacterium]MDD5742410.1 hypothetical protein [Candidatus Peribacteraceae bacterium]